METYFSFCGNSKTDETACQHVNVCSSKHNKRGSPLAYIVCSNVLRLLLIVSQITVQWCAGMHEKLLRRNNIYYLGHYGRKTLPQWNLHDVCTSCYDHKAKDCTKRWRDFENTVEHH